MKKNEKTECMRLAAGPEPILPKPKKIKKR